MEDNFSVQYFLLYYNSRIQNRVFQITLNKCLVNETKPQEFYLLEALILLIFILLFIFGQLNVSNQQIKTLHGKKDAKKLKLAFE